MFMKSINEIYYYQKFNYSRKYRTKQEKILILLIESNAIFRHAYLALLEKIPCKINLLFTGRQAIQHIKLNKISNKFYLIFLTINLIDISETKIFQSIHEIEKSLIQKIYIVFISVKLNKKIGECCAVNFNQPIKKIENPLDFLKMVKPWLIKK